MADHGGMDKHSGTGFAKGANHHVGKKGDAHADGGVAAVDPHDPNYEDGKDDKFVYYLANSDDWNKAHHNGSWKPTEQEKAKGFIQLYEANQVAKAGRSHFKGVDHLLLVEFSASKLGDGLVYEENTPRFYGNLPTKGKAFSKTYKLPLRADGSGHHTFPQHLQ